MDSALPRLRGVRPAGFGLVVTGLLSLLIPMASPVRAVALLGWLLGLAAAVEIVNAVETRDLPAFAWRAAGALLWASAGIFMLVRPIWGAVGVAMALGLALVARGVVHAVLSWEMRAPGFALVALFSLALGALAVAGWPTDSIGALSLEASVALLATGLAYSFGLDSRTRSEPSSRSSHM